MNVIDLLVLHAEVAEAPVEIGKGIETENTEAAVPGQEVEAADATDLVQEIEEHRKNVQNTQGAQEPDLPKGKTQYHKY